MGLVAKNYTTVREYYYNDERTINPFSLIHDLDVLFLKLGECQSVSRQPLAQLSGLEESSWIPQDPVEQPVRIAHKIGKMRHRSCQGVQKMLETLGDSEIMNLYQNY